MDANAVAIEFSKLSALITTTNNTLCKKIEESQETAIKCITDKLEATERSIRVEITQLKDEDSNLRHSIEQNKIIADAQLNDLNHKVHGLTEQIKASLLAVNAANNRTDAVTNHVEYLEKSFYRSQQHGYGWNMEFEGIPSAVGDDPVKLEEAIIAILASIGVVVDHNEIDTVHRLPSKTVPKTTIVRFHSRKLVREVHDNKRKLNINDLNIVLEGLDANSKIFINASQSPYMKNIAFNCRQLKRDRLIEGVMIGKDGRLSVKLHDGNYLKIGHKNDLLVNFPDYENFMFNVNPLVGTMVR